MYMCILCGEKFLFKPDILDHISTAHREDFSDWLEENRLDEFVCFAEIEAWHIYADYTDGLITETDFITQAKAELWDQYVDIKINTTDFLVWADKVILPS